MRRNPPPVNATGTIKDPPYWTRPNPAATGKVTLAPRSPDQSAANNLKPGSPTHALVQIAAAIDPCRTRWLPDHPRAAQRSGR